MSSVERLFCSLHFRLMFMCACVFVCTRLNLVYMKNRLNECASVLIIVKQKLMLVLLRFVSNVLCCICCKLSFHSWHWWVMTEMACTGSYPVLIPVWELSRTLRVYLQGLIVIITWIKICSETVWYVCMYGACGNFLFHFYIVLSIWMYCA